MYTYKFMCILLKSRFILFLPIVDKQSKVYQTGILRVNQIFECVDPNSHQFFFRETQKFENCTQTAFRFLQRNTKFWKLHPSGDLFFDNETHNLESCTQTAIYISHKKIRNLTIYQQFSFVP